MRPRRCAGVPLCSQAPASWSRRWRRWRCWRSRSRKGGREPFAASAFWPIPLLAAGLLVAVPRRDLAVRAAVVLYALACAVAFALPTPVGGNAARLGVLVAGPLAALALYPRRRLLLLACAPVLLYLQWHAAIADVATASGSASTTASYYRPLLSFLEHEGREAGPFRIEIPFTADPLGGIRGRPAVRARAGLGAPARHRRRQPLLRRAPDRGAVSTPGCTGSRSGTWRCPTSPLDRSAIGEARLIRAGLPYLRLVLHTRHWHVYAVVDAVPIATGSATATAIGPNWVALAARGAGRSVVRVRWSPYWRLSGAHGCVSRLGSFVAVRFRHAGRARLVIDFSLARIGAGSPRCS